MIWAALLLLPLAILLWGGASLQAEELPALVRPYQEARAMGRLGSLDGMAYREPTSPGGPSQPYASLSILLIPDSAELEKRLDTIRSHHRDSGRTYTAAHQAIVDALRRYRSAVAEAGGGDLAYETVSAADGRFRFEVPAGRWLLLGWGESSHPRQAKRVGKRVSGEFVENLEHAGYVAVAYWKVPVDVGQGQATEVRLHDRNVWFTAIREDLRVPGSAPTGPAPPSKGGKAKGATQ